MSPLLERQRMIDVGKGNGFADDEILLATSEMALQQLLDRATRWARLTGMAWNTENSEPIGARHSYRLAEKTLETTSETTYLGITLNRCGVQQGELISRLDKARK